MLVEITWITKRDAVTQEKAETTAFTETQGPWGKGKGAGLAVYTGHTSHVNVKGPGGPPQTGAHTLPPEVLPRAGQRPRR